MSFLGYVPGLSARVTERQLELLRLMQAYFQQNGVFPSAADLADGLKPAVHVNTAWGMIIALRRKGLVQSTYGTHRSLRLTAEGKAVVQQAEGIQAHAVAEAVTQVAV